MGWSMSKELTLTLVIPVYNEQRYIKACLEAIANQSRMPDEVLVIDNNSTDKTVQIASRFPFVRIIKESTQGLIAARNCGFNSAKSDILARIDADTVLNKDWVRGVVHQLSTQPNVVALTGHAVAETFPRLNLFRSTLWTRLYFLSSDAYLQVRVLWGANMALRRSMWQKIKNNVCLDDSLVHEDQDLSFLIAGQGGLVKRGHHLLISTDASTYHGWHKITEYTRRRTSTRRYHHKRRTLNQPGALKRSIWYNIPANIITFVPFVLFMVTSFLFDLPTSLHKNP
jgi:glycosyltransferase involved in cell wall biosynthesis